MIIYFDSFYSIKTTNNIIGKIIKINNNAFEISTDNGSAFIIGKTNFDIGSIVSIEGQKTTLNDLSFINYLKSRNITFNLKLKTETLISKSYSIKTYIENFVNSQNNLYKDFTNIFILGKINNLELKEKFMNLNIIHLFVISGFHIYYINKVLNKIFRFKSGDFISLIIIFIYLSLIDFQIPSTKTFFILLISKINKKFWNKNLSNMHIFFIVLNFYLLNNVNNIYSLSFVLTFVFSFFINLINSVKIKHKYLKNIFFWFFINIISITLNLYLNGSISLFMPLYGIIYTIIISIIYPIIFLTWWLIPFSNLIYWIFENTIYFFNSFNLVIKINQFSIWLIYELYLLYFIILFILICKTNRPKYYAHFYV